MRYTFNRRAFLAQAGALGALGLAGCATSRAGQEFAGVFPAHTDEVTGAVMYNLTPRSAKDVIIYQTHPMWTLGMEHLVFHGEGGIQALSMATGEIRTLLEFSPPFSMQWWANALYYVQDRTLYRLNVAEAYAGRGTPERVAELPAEYLGLSGGLSVDMQGDAVYCGVELEAGKRWGIAHCYMTGWRTIGEVDFQVGHVQAHPLERGQVMFCWETGGDAPQRTWLTDALTSEVRPAYPEQNDEWVTHEVWWGAGILFTIWPYDDAHRALPHGVAWSRRDDGRREVLAQYPAWHTHGSPDGRWVLGDDFERNIWLIDPKTRERRLLTQGHLGEGFKTHPHASFTPDSRAILLNSSRFGSEDIVLVPLPEWGSLPRAEAL